MATLTLEETRLRYDALVDLAEQRGVPLVGIEIRDMRLWVIHVERELDIEAGASIPTR